MNCWDLEDASEPDQQLRVLDQLLLLEDGRQQFFLDIHYDQRTLIRIQGPAGDFAVIAGKRTEIAKSSYHEGLAPKKHLPLP